MKTLNKAIAIAVLGTIGAPALAQDNATPILEVTTLEVKLGHDSEFRAGIQAYRNCYAENDGAGDWSMWQAVEGKAGVYHVVSEMDGWVEMDTPDPAGQKCWGTVEDQISPHLTSVSTQFARRMPEWSGAPGEFSVVRLHQFRVDDEDAFESAVSAITSVMKEAEYEHMGTWYDVINPDSNEPGYFVVAHYKNFAAMDAERASPYQTVRDQAGQARADELWSQFGDALTDDWEYSSELLRRVDDLSYSAGE